MSDKEKEKGETVKKRSFKEKREKIKQEYQELQEFRGQRKESLEMVAALQVQFNLNYFGSLKTMQEKLEKKCFESATSLQEHSACTSRSWELFKKIKQQNYDDVKAGLEYTEKYDVEVIKCNQQVSNSDITACSHKADQVLISDMFKLYQSRFCNNYHNLLNQY